MEESLFDIRPDNANQKQIISSRLNNGKDINTKTFSAKKKVSYIDNLESIQHNV